MRAFTDPKRPAVGETTFLVEDYVAGSAGVRSCRADRQDLPQTRRPKLTVDGRYLYGAPASELDLEGEIVIGAAKERPGFAGYQFGLADEEVETSRKPLEDLPQTDDNGKASFDGRARQGAGDVASAGSQGDRAPGRSRRPRGRAQDHAAGRRRPPT